MLINDPVRDTPICVFSWMDALQRESAQTRIRRIIEVDGHQAQISYHSITTRDEMTTILKQWYRKSSNAQYVLFISHGINGKTEEEWFGIGFDGENKNMIEWDDLWTSVVVGKGKPPSIVMLGCRTASAIRDWNGRITRRVNNPYVVGLSEVVSGTSLWLQTASLLRVLVSNVTQMNPVVTIERVVENLKGVSKIVEVYYPVLIPGRSRPVLTEVSSIPEVREMSFVEYLSEHNRWAHEQWVKRSNRYRVTFS